MRVFRLLTTVFAFVVIVSSCSGGGDSAASKAGTDISGVVVERASGRSHRNGQINYPGKHPPSGGDHNPVPLTCGFYNAQQPDEYAVHSLEHGAVWIAFDPSTAPANVVVLKAFAGPKVLVMPYAGMDTPITVVAWARRLEVSSASDPRIKQFVDELRDGPTAPERGGACVGVGQPAS